MNILWKTIKKRLHSATVTAKDRANQKGNNDFYAESGKLFCRVCIKVVDHTRQGSVDRHKATEMHKRNKVSKLQQKTPTTTFPIPTTAKYENITNICYWVKMLAGANIPFNVTNNSQVRQFLLDHTRNGGAIPKAAGLLPYLSDVYQSNLG